MLPPPLSSSQARLLLALSALVVLGLTAGCDSKPNGVAKEEVTKLYESPKSKPSNLDRTHLRLLHQNHALYIGDDQSRVFEVFGAPSGATDVADLPEGWDKERYRVKGWEKGKDGFGVILYEDNIALALFTSEGRNAGDLKELQDIYQDILGKPGGVIEHKDSLYWFWQSEGQRLMLMALKTPSENYKITQALGAVELMDALRMSETAAKNDSAAASTLQAKAAP